MITIILNSNKIQVMPGTSVFDVAMEADATLARAALACIVNENICELTFTLTTDSTVELIGFDHAQGKRVFWHTASHVLAHAVTNLFPNAKLAIGPAIDSGFYYDFEVEQPFSADDLIKITAQMKKIVKSRLRLERFKLPVDEALALMKDAPYKLELIKEHADKGENLSFYRQGEFVDLCAGPHLFEVSKIKAIALLSSTGAYWRGDSKNKMLQRIYGIAFPNAAELEAHLTILEEAKKRDHNKLGRELEYFTTCDVIGQGLPILLPKGARVIQLLQRFVEDEEEKRGYQLTKTPLIAKSDIYKISGHWDHYREGMFVIGDPEKEGDVLALRPMTCPFQYQVFLNRMRSYRDLPMRLSETSTLFRNEDSGEMHGLIRVRQFTISEAHIICTPAQLEQEFKQCVELANFMLTAVGLVDDVSYRFSKWDPSDSGKYIGTPAQWDEAQSIMAKILEHMALPHSIGIGEAAFYGPKLDIQIKNVFGKEDTIITIQIDQMLAENFEMEYVDTDGTRKRPYIIHRTSLGCFERTLALMIEKFAGALPTWIAPQQVVILPISDKVRDVAIEVEQKLRDSGLRVSCDLRNEKIGYKIREAQMEKIPYMLVIGEKEATEGTVSLRSRKDGDLGVLPLTDFITNIREEIADRK